MGKAKRVRFSDNETDELPNNGPNTSSGGGEAALPQVFDAPKTSEYAFFKKIKKDAGRSYCRVHPQEDNQLKSGKSRIRKSVGNSNVSDSLKWRVPHTDMALEGMGGTKQNSFFSPPMAAKERAFVSPPKDTIDKVKQRSSRLTGNIAPFDQNVFFSPIAGGSFNSGSQYFGKGIFAGKRQKLHQLAADTLLPEIGESSVKGLDLVPILLGRLFPKDNKTDVKELVEGQNHANDQLPPSPMSYASERKLNLIHRKRSRELKNESSWSDLAPRYSSSNSRTIICSEADHPLATYDAKYIVQDGLADYNHVSDRKVISSWFRQRDSSLCLPYERYGHTGSYRIQELDGDYDPFEASRTELHNLLLEWEFNRHKEKPDFYRTPSGIEEHMYSMLSTRRDDHNQQIVNVKLDEIAMPMLSFFPQYSSKYNPFTHFNPTSFHSWDMRRGGLEYDSPVDLGPNRLSSWLSCTPKYLTQGEDFDTSNVFGSGNAILSGQDHPSCLDIDLGWKCLSVANLPGESQLPAYHPFQYPPKKEICQYYLTEEGQDSLHSSNSTGSDLSSYEAYSFTNNTFDRAMGRPLLLDNSSWNELYLLDDDDDYKQNRHENQIP